MESKAAAQVVQAAVPLAELFGYTTTLRTLTAGRASASLKYERYQTVPEIHIGKIVSS